MARSSTTTVITIEAESAPSLFFEAQPIRTVILDGKRWLVASDVCRLLGLQRSRAGVSRLDDDESAMAVIATAGGLNRPCWSAKAAPII